MDTVAKILSDRVPNEESNENEAQSDTEINPPPRLSLAPLNHSFTNDYLDDSGRNGEYLCSIFIPPRDWAQLSKCYSSVTSNNRERRKFRVQFHNYLNDKAQELGVVCRLVTQFNWLNSRNTAWNGGYVCLRPGCPAKYKAILKNIDRTGVNEVKLYITGKPSHTDAVIRNRRKAYYYNIDMDLSAPVETITENGYHEPDEITDVTEMNFLDSQQANKSNQGIEVDQFDQSEVTELPNGYNNHTNGEQNGDQYDMYQFNSDPTQWICEEVCGFVCDLVGSDISNLFKWHEIDGQALDYLQVENLVNTMHIKLGQAAKIKSRFDEAKRSFADQAAKHQKKGKK